MKDESIQFVKSVFENPLSYLKLGTPQVHENMTVIPIIVQDEKFIEFINIKEAEELELCTIVKGTPTIPASVVVEWFKKKAEKYYIKKVVADRFRYSALKEEFDKEGLEYVAIANGAPTHNKLNPLITKMFAEETLVFGDDKLMRWYCNNVYVDTDKKGNKTYLKIEPIKRKTDGFFAFLHAMVVDEELQEQTGFMSLGVHTY